MHHNGRVLVTGANGLLGSNVVIRMVASGYRVIAVVRKGSNQIALKGVNCDIVESDLTENPDLEKSFSGCDYVVHCAANTSQNANRPELFKEINFDITSILIRLCKRYRIKRFIFVSTANCFTNGTLQCPGDEREGFMPWLKCSGYAYSKFLAQQMVLEEVKRSGFPAIVVAPTLIIGPGDAKVSSGKLLMYPIKNRVVFYPPGGKSIVDAEFAADAIVNSLTIGVVGESYLLAGENLTYKQIFKKTSKISGKRIFLIYVPVWCLVIITFFFSVIEYVFGVSFALNRTNRRLLCLGNYFSNSKAVDQLFLIETDSDAAISKAVLWYKANGYL